MKRLERQPRAHTQVRPYVVKENDDKKRRFYCPHNFRYFYSIPRNADVTNTPDVKYATQKTRGEISSAVNCGFLSRGFLD